MKKLLATAAATLAVSAIAGAANAAPVTYIFQNPGADTPVSGNFTTGGQCHGINISGPDLCSIDNALGFDYDKGGISVNVTALNFAGAASLVQDLSPENSGLAVLSPGEGPSDDQVQLSTAEALEFDFAMPVFLQGIDFNAGADRNCATPGKEGPCGTFDLFVDGSLFGSYTAMDDMLFPNIVGSLFRVVATGPLDGGFTIGSLTVSEVPVPAAGLLLLTGAAGLGFGSRRKKA